MKQLKLKGNEKILVVRPDRIGDLVLTLPLAYLIKEIYPKIKIEYLVSAYNFPLLRYAGYIDGALLIDDGRLIRKAAGELIAELESKRYDIVLFAKPDLYTAFCANLAGIPVRLGTARRGYSLLFNFRTNISRRYSMMHELDLNLCLLKPFGISAPDSINPVLNISDNQPDEMAELKGIGEFAVVHPGSKGSAPNWPSDYYAELIKRLSKSMTVVVSGQGIDDFSGLENVISLIDRTDFGQLVRTLERARLFVSGSTGPIHIAAALGTPVLGLYPDHKVLGAQRWGPRGKSVEILTPAKHDGHICRINAKGSCSCLESISVDLVCDKALKMVESRGSVR